MCSLKLCNALVRAIELLDNKKGRTDIAILMERYVAYEFERKYISFQRSGEERKGNG